MITEIKGKCQFEGCEAIATHIACGRQYDRDAVKGHPTPGCYCEKHATAVADEHNPEYLDNCPNCGCLFGIN